MKEIGGLNDDNVCSCLVPVDGTPPVAPASNISAPTPDLPSVIPDVGAASVPFVNGE